MPHAFDPTCQYCVGSLDEVDRLAKRSLEPLLTVRELKQRLNAELARGRPVCVPPMDYVAQHCWLGFGTVRRCPNQCKGVCGYARTTEDYLDALADLL